VGKAGNKEQMGVAATGVAVYCSVLQRVAVCGTGVAVCGSVWQCVAVLVHIGMAERWPRNM